ncbi:MAG: OadG family protein [Chloroflexi bacterium]|nr:OadG family protein [Chloroflexota bacterium]
MQEGVQILLQGMGRVLLALFLIGICIYLLRLLMNRFSKPATS